MSDTGTVLIRADGDHGIGLGHIYRARTLGFALADLGWQVAYVTLKDTIGASMLQDTGLAVFTTSDPAGVYVSPQVLAEVKPSVVVLDVLDCDPAGLADLRQATQARLITMDDTQAGLALADGVINAIVSLRGSYSSKAARARLYEGPAYMILNGEVAALKSRRAPVSEPTKTVLLSFGGTDTHNVTERMVSALNVLEARFRIRINMGPGSEPSDQLEAAVAASPHEVEILRTSPSLIAEFCAADMVVCGGGVSLYELAALGVPAAALATEPHEKDTIGFFAAQGTVVDLGWEGDMDFAGATATIGQLAADADARRDMAVRGPALVDGRGLERCVEIISGVVSP